MKGLVESEKIKDFGPNKVLAKYTTRIFYVNDQQFYRELFNRKDIKCNLVDGEYKLDLWIYLSIDGVRRKNRKYDFSNIKDGLLKQALKAFTLILLTSNKHTYTNKKFVKIKNFLEKQSIINEKNIGNIFKKYLLFDPETGKTRSDNTQYEIAIAWIEFLNFAQLENELSDILSISKHIVETDLRNKNIRKLPKYTDVLIFDEAIRRHRKVCDQKSDLGDDDHLILFYPLFLWWRISNIIPMRSTEFLQLKRNCLDRIDGTDVLQIEREKDPNEVITQIPVESKIPISNELANDIERYINLTNSLHNQSVNQLCSYLNYYHIMRKYGFCRVHRKTVNIDELMFNDAHMAKLFDVFYKLIEEEYKDLLIPEIEDGKLRYLPLDRLTLGDTRHFTIYQLRMKGLSALTIARLAGHTKIETQEKYLQHSEWFAQSEVKVLEERLFMALAYIEQNMDINFTDWLEFEDGKAIEISLRRSNTTNIEELPVVDELCGVKIRCLDDPKSCRFGGECCKCTFSYVLYEDWNDEIRRYFINNSNDLKKRMLEVIDSLQMLAKSMKFDFKNLTSKSPWEEARLKQLVHEKKALQFQQAVINAKLRKYSQFIELEN
ncbi:hypothetical protein [Paenibacillus sp. MBLB4367]|uniref:hypothetical protein n=1 Tax=Paenibacillus sp. MBLB4367 TaxID=3384767 RepID=UPI003908329C